MSTPQASASPPKIIGFTCTEEELFNSFDNLTGGSPLPSNVIDENPYRYDPQHFPDDVWFLISSDENIYAEHGIWKTKEEAREVFSNSEIIGWRTTLEYYEGQVPGEQKTEWVMQVFSITQKRVFDDNDKKETRSLCRVFRVSSHEMQQRVSNTSIENETRNNLTHPPVLDANSSTRVGSSRNPEVNVHHETEILAVTRRLPVPVPVPVPVPEHQGDNLVEMDLYSPSRGDFLELQDLENPVSSSSSENSSAVSISSDECFDSMAFLRDLEDPILEQNDAGRRLSVSATNKLDEVVIVPPTLGSLVSVEGNNKVAEHAQGNQRGEGPSSSSSHNPSTSSDSHTAAGGRKRAGSCGMKKLLKYLCCMPF